MLMIPGACLLDPFCLRSFAVEKPPIKNDHWLARQYTSEKGHELL